MTADPTNPAPPVEELRKRALDVQRKITAVDEVTDVYVIPALLNHLSSLTVENERLRRIAYGPLRSAQHALDIIGGSPWASEGHSELAREESARIETAIQSLSSLPAMKGEG